MTLDGKYLGPAPVEIDVPPDRAFEIQASKAGFEDVAREVRSESGKVAEVTIDLVPELGEVQIVYSPAEARFYAMLTQFIVTGQAYASSLSGANGQAVTLVLIALQKLASSSVAAILRALRRRLATVMGVEAARSRLRAVLSDYATAADDQDLDRVSALEELRLMELARALAAKPKVLVSDEAMAGLSGSEVDEILEILLALNKTGVAVIMIEHIMRAVMKFSERVAVLDAGQKIAEGDPKAIIANPEVQRAYLGE